MKSQKVKENDGRLVILWIRLFEDWSDRCARRTSLPPRRPVPRGIDRDGDLSADPRMQIYSKYSGIFNYVNICNLNSAEFLQ